MVVHGRGSGSTNENGMKISSRTGNVSRKRYKSNFIAALFQFYPYIKLNFSNIDS